ncbi:succinyl-CoA synthetase beta subunit [Acrasis kona]|uniref:Succinate--CoA ligase [ADP-forming] subunit beta, mitochondrial n=1 Tax=Acrasis kona TaxID=1008807 RepID=A0AAW2YTC9_9EUKA
MFRAISGIKSSISKSLISQQRRLLNIQEYHAKELLGKYNVPHQRGFCVTDLDGVDGAVKKVKDDFYSKNFIVKAQVLAGGRGKGHFLENNFKGGVKFVKTAEDVRGTVKQMLGNTLVTKQTTKDGIKVSKVFIAECLDFKRELYFAILLDRSYDGPVMVASTQGGVDIETVAEETPHLIHSLPIDVKTGPKLDQLLDLAGKLELEGSVKRSAAEAMLNLYNLFTETDCTLVEVNPLVQTDDDQISCVDCKINIDDNAEFRKKDIFETMRDFAEEDPREVEASKVGLNYVGLDGNIGCMVNGAGLAMATMDIIKLHGGSPANFLDVGGGATTQQVKEAFKILTSDKAVRAILVNIFGGIMRCDVIAQGIIDAARDIELKIPLVVRLEGTNVEQGKKLLEDCDFVKLETADDLDDAAKKAVKGSQSL